MTTLYPVGYGTSRVDMTELQRRHAHGMDPEYARRLFTWLASQNGKFGIGGGWRPTPSSVSQASKEGKSFHQTQTFFDGFKGYCAVDLVVYVGGGQPHRAPTRSEAVWQGSAAAKAAGVHCNIDSETWHMQPVEIDGWLSWVNGGRVRPKVNYPISNPVVVTPPTSVPGLPPFHPEVGEFSLYPIATNKPVLQIGMSGQPSDAIRYFQAVCRLRAMLNIGIDGYYGSQSANAAKLVRSWNGLPAGTTVDASVWKAIDAMAMR